MSEVHTYSTAARWTGRRSGEVEAEGVAEPLRFSAPLEFQGEAGLWSPETLLLAAAETGTQCRNCWKFLRRLKRAPRLAKVTALRPARSLEGLHRAA